MATIYNLIILMALVWSVVVLVYGARRAQDERRTAEARALQLREAMTRRDDAITERIKDELRRELGLTSGVGRESPAPYSGAVPRVAETVSDSPDEGVDLASYEGRWEYLCRNTMETDGPMHGGALSISVELERLDSYGMGIPAVRLSGERRWATEGDVKKWLSAPVTLTSVRGGHPHQGATEINFETSDGQTGALNLFLALTDGGRVAGHFRLNTDEAPVAKGLLDMRRMKHEDDLIWAPALRSRDVSA